MVDTKATTNNAPKTSEAPKKPIPAGDVWSAKGDKSGVEPVKTPDPIKKESKEPSEPIPVAAPVKTKPKKKARF